MLGSGIALVLLSISASPASISDINAMAQRKDVDGLTNLLVPLPKETRNPFKVLETGGAYGVGRYGWQASELVSADGSTKYVVIGTPLTSEDVGEILLQRVGDRLDFVPESNQLGAIPCHHQFDIKFDVPKKSVHIQDVLRLHYNAECPTSPIFRMSPAYRVAKIVSSAGRKVPFHQSSGVVSFLRGKGSDESLRIEYDAVVNLPDYAGSISNDEATLVNDYWYPMIGRWPATYTATIHSPKGWITVAQGRKIFEGESEGERLTKYSMELPVVYFSLISAKFKRFSDMVRDRTMTTWSTRMTEDEMHAQNQLYGEIFDFYARKFCPPPYSMYGAVDSKTYGGGALEAYTFATWGGGLPFEDAHEPSHTWWGGLINNTYLNSFWNESFAVFSDGLYHRNFERGNAEERRQAFISDGSATPDFSEAAIETSGADIGGVGSSLGYGKGAKVLQMFEEWLGTKNAILALHTWASEHRRGTPGNWSDFERVAKRLFPNKDIVGFFDDWIRRPGFAAFDADVRWSDSEVDIQLRWKGPRFRMPLTVMLQKATGGRSFQTVWLDGQHDEIKLPCAEKPSLVSIDPWRQSVRMIGKDEQPEELAMEVGEMKKVVDRQHGDWVRSVGTSPKTVEEVKDPSNLFMVGSPESLPAMKPLCEIAGFKVSGSSLTYKGTTIDLDKGCALAIVQLPNGKKCVIGLGKTRIKPDFGRTRLLLTDDLGRLVRGETEPKTSGRLTYRLDPVH